MNTVVETPATVNGNEENIKELARLITIAAITKLKIQDKYTTCVRWYGAPCALPFVEIGLTPKGKPPETHEFSVSLPAIHFVCKDRDSRSSLANYLFKQISLGVAKYEAK